MRQAIIFIYFSLQIRRPRRGKVVSQPVPGRAGTGAQEALSRGCSPVSEKAPNGEGFCAPAIRPTSEQQPPHCAATKRPENTCHAHLWKLQARTLTYQGCLRGSDEEKIAIGHLPACDF